MYEILCAICRYIPIFVGDRDTKQRKKDIYEKVEFIVTDCSCWPISSELCRSKERKKSDKTTYKV
ncbi:hypothetical protein Tsumi_10990 [Porphyromonas miyakawae]|uniref:Uncharacterized protein n=1 Tax=Porphyromonas miyakawae TaxID=3137470 RepID=A0ABQ0E2R8_9PORP